MSGKWLLGMASVMPRVDVCLDGGCQEVQAAGRGRREVPGVRGGSGSPRVYGPLYRHGFSLEWDGSPWCLQQRVTWPGKTFRDALHAGLGADGRRASVAHLMAEERSHEVFRSHQCSVTRASRHRGQWLSLETDQQQA